MSCQQDSDCRAGGLGCVADGDRLICAADSCLKDTDCGSGEVCTCDESGVFSAPQNACVSANCTTDTDCAKGTSCSPSYSVLGYGVEGYYCHTFEDSCTNASDCPPPSKNGYRTLCQYNGRRWTCNYSNAIE